MQDLVVCVGEKCHQSGAELVLKSFMDIIAREKLADNLCLKGSFCIGECCEKDEVSVRMGERVFQVNPQEAYLAFARDVWPALRSRQADPTPSTED